MKHLILLLLASLTSLHLAAQAQPTAENMPVVKNLEAVMSAMEYPASAKEKNIEGKVIAKILVSKDGKVEGYEILKSTHEMFKTTVEQHLSELKFKPGKMNGEAIKCYVTIPFTFRLPDDNPKPTTSITEALQNPGAVVTLELEGHHRLDFPRELGDCNRMRELILDDTAIEKVPSFIKKLDALESISLTDNMLTSVPGWLAKLPALKDIDLRGNPIDQDTADKLRERFADANINLLID